jgi:hypothetical protein
MAKTPTFPALFDEVKTISITFLVKQGFLNPNQIQSKLLNWTINGNKTGSIFIIVDTHCEQPYIELQYKCNEVPINYRVNLITIPSNLGKGVIWFFLCPQTNKRCRKLYLIDTYFYHRSAFRGCMYEKQTKSKYYRYLDKTFGTYFKSDELYKQLHSKYFKTHYSGRPTKKYLRIIEQINKAENIPYSEFEKQLLR